MQDTLDEVTDIDTKDNSEDGGMSGWAVFGIFLLVLVILSCVGYVTFKCIVNQREQQKRRALAKILFVESEFAAVSDDDSQEMEATTY